MIFVMPATSAVGQDTIQALMNTGTPASQLIAGGRDLKKLESLARAGVATRQADYGDRKGLEKAFQGAETLILIPTKTLPGPRCLEYDNALEAAKAANVKRVVFVSIQAATPETQFTIGSFILFAECATRLSGMEWAIARMSLYIDPVADWIPDLKSMGRLPYPIKNGRIAYVSRCDVARGVAAVASKNLKSEIVDLTGPAALSMPELAQAVSRASGTNIPFASVSEEEFREICRKDKTPEHVIELFVTMYRAAEAQEFSKATNDIERLTGAAPESAEQALVRLLAEGNHSKE